jgi:hypothetical protein
MRTAAFGSLLVVAAVTAATAGSWEAIRRDVVEPINAEFHRHLPTYLKTHDLEALNGLYVTETGTGLWTIVEGAPAGDAVAKEL